MANEQKVKIIKGTITKEIYVTELPKYIADGWSKLITYPNTEANKNLFNKIK